MSAYILRYIVANLTVGAISGAVLFQISLSQVALPGVPLVLVIGTALASFIVSYLTLKAHAKSAVFLSLLTAIPWTFIVIYSSLALYIHLHGFGGH